jgi:hypothetical protein
MLMMEDQASYCVFGRTSFDFKTAKMQGTSQLNILCFFFFSPPNPSPRRLRHPYDPTIFRLFSTCKLLHEMIGFPTANRHFRWKLTPSMIARLRLGQDFGWIQGINYYHFLFVSSVLVFASRVLILTLKSKME